MQDTQFLEHSLGCVVVLLTNNMYTQAAQAQAQAQQPMWVVLWRLPLLTLSC